MKDNHKNRTDYEDYIWGVRAECRITGKRKIIRRNMQYWEAKNFIPDRWDKKNYRYFRVVDTRNYEKGI